VPSRRRVVTGVTRGGRSRARIAGACAGNYTWPDGGGLYEIWTEPPAPMQRASGADTATGPVRLCPADGEIKVRWFTIMPAGATPADPEVLEQVVASGFAELGATAARPDTRRHPAMHLTQTFDVITIVQGQVRLLLDDGEELLGPGDVVVQRGTNHAWVCEGSEPALMVAVLVSRDFASEVQDRD
jgi:mannose-6-phosphate isomerase-like protein (cupin superfamily)